jgi:hypothetical protein
MIRSCGARGRVVRRRPLVRSAVRLERLGLLRFEDGCLGREFGTGLEVLSAPCAHAPLPASAHEEDDREGDVPHGQCTDDNQEREDKRIRLAIRVHDRRSTFDSRLAASRRTGLL